MKTSPLKWYRVLFNYFLRGLIFIAPVYFTIYALYIVFRWADGLIHDFFPQLFPGAGLLILLASVTFIGVLTKLFVFNWFIEWIEHLINKAPLTKLIYTSLKDLFSAFVGDRKKMFSQPVMVMLFKEAGIRKLGFVTRDDLSAYGMNDLVAVYFPHSYNFSGNMYLVPKENIQPLPLLHGADAMKFIVSGGVTEIEKVNDKK